MNAKIKYNSKIKQWIVSYDEQLKLKLYRKQEFFRDEELAKKRFNEL